MKSAATNPRARPGLVVVIGVGSTLRGDDAAGHAVAAILQSANSPAPLHIITTHQLAPELAVPLSRASLAIVIDAAATSPPGRVTCRPVAAEHWRSRRCCHDNRIDNLLALSQRLFHRAPETWLITIGGASWDYGSPLSPAVVESIPAALHWIDFIAACRLPSRN